MSVHEEEKSLLPRDEYIPQGDLDVNNLANCSDPYLGTKIGYSSTKKLPKRSCHNVALTVYLTILHAVCLMLCMALWTKYGISNVPNNRILDFDNRYPDWVPVSYELRDEYALENPESEFSGMPTAANTQAWDELITPTYFSASMQDLQKTGESVNDSVLLADGGYLAGLGIYHDIHCLRRLRLFLHSDHYYVNLTEANMLYLRGHLGHCIESLRRSVMCNADTNIFTFTWKDAEEVRPGIFRPNPKSNQEKKCVQWDPLHDWLMERHVPLQPMLLRPDGEKEKILMVRDEY